MWFLKKNNVIQPFKVSLKEAIKIKLTLTTMIITTWLRFRGFMNFCSIDTLPLSKKQYMDWQHDLKDNFLMYCLCWVRACTCSLHTHYILQSPHDVWKENVVNMLQRKCAFGRWQVIKIMHTYCYCHQHWHS